MLAEGRWFETKEAGHFAQPSLVYVCSGAGNGTRTRDILLDWVLTATRICPKSSPQMNTPA